MTTYYCTVHWDEDQGALLGADLDALNTHMVHDTGYDLKQLKAGLPNWKVIWEMERSKTAKFGWKFKRLISVLD